MQVTMRHSWRLERFFLFNRDLHKYCFNLTTLSGNEPTAHEREIREGAEACTIMLNNEK